MQTNYIANPNPKLNLKLCWKIDLAQIIKPNPTQKHNPYGRTVLQLDSQPSVGTKQQTGLVRLTRFLESYKKFRIVRVY